MKGLLLVIFILVVHFVSAICHEADMRNAYERDGDFSSVAYFLTWQEHSDE